MKTTHGAVAIYARISQDRTGAKLGIQRQLEDCRRFAESRGWPVAEEYVDDDVSAYSGKRRPAYERMLDDIASGSRDVIVTWHMDRIHRNVVELEELRLTCMAAGVNEIHTPQGSYDLGTGDGRFFARMQSVFAAQESDRKSERGRRKALQIAESGRPMMGGNYRPFGFEEDRITHNAAEAQIVRLLADRLLAGESLTSAARWLATQGVTTVSGAMWRTQVLRQMMTNPRYYGVRTHRGEALGPAAWDPIISQEKGEALRHKLLDPARRTNGTARRYVLSGLCRCSLCGTVMYSVPRYEERRYLCRSGHDFGGCGRMSINANGVERIVTEAVLIRLDSPELHDALAGRVHDDAARNELSRQLVEDTKQLEEVTDLWTDKKITTAQWRRAGDTLNARIAKTRQRLNNLAGGLSIEAHVGRGNAIRDQWAELTLDNQVAIVKGLVDHVEVLPGKRGARSVEVARVRPVWRL